MEIKRKGPYLNNNFILQFIGEKGYLILEKKYTFLKK